MTGAALQLWPALVLALVAVVGLCSVVHDLRHPWTRPTPLERVALLALAGVFAAGAALCGWWVYQLLPVVVLSS